MDEEKRNEPQNVEETVDEMQQAMDVEPKESTVGSTAQSQPADAEEDKDTTAPATGAFGAPIKSKKRKMLVVGGIVAAAVAILGGSGVFAYTAWYQNPDKVVSDALINAIKARTLTGAGTVTATSTNYSMNLTFDTQSTSTEGVMNVKADITSGQGKDKVTFAASGSGLYKDKTLYLKLNDVAKTVKDLEKSYGEELPGYIDPIVKKIDGRWISFKPSDYEEIDKEAAKQQECMINVFEKLESDKEMRDEVIKLYSDNKMIIVKEELGSKSIEGVGSLGYKIDGDKAATENFTRGLGDTKFGKAIKECDSSVDFAKQADEIAKAEDSKDNVTVELWVSRFGHEITQLTVKGSDSDTTVDATFNPKFNKDVAVEAPSDAISVKQLMEDIEKAVEKYYEEQLTQTLQQQSTTGVNISQYNFN